MKNYVVLFFLLLSTAIFSQTTSKDMGKITKAKLAEVSLLDDLVPDHPTDFKSVSIELVARINGKVVMASSETITFSDAFKDILKTADVGSKFLMDVNFDAQLNGAKSYKFFTVE